ISWSIQKDQIAIMKNLSLNSNHLQYMTKGHSILFVECMANRFDCVFVNFGLLSKEIQCINAVRNPFE
ncbi:hypothetical protein CGK04_22965, partial [Vibrio parahaemolyticus]